MTRRAMGRFVRRALTAVFLAAAALFAWIAFKPDIQALWRGAVESVEAVLGRDLDAVPDAREQPAKVSPANAKADGEAKEGPRVEVVGGRPAIRIDESTQERIGIETVTLKPVTFSPEIASFGRVLDLQPLLAQRARYSTARYQGDVVRATLSAAKREFDRLTKLHRDEGDIATKRLQEGEAEVARQEAELRRFDAEMASVRDETRQQWGEVLTRWALDKSSPEFERLLARQDVLLLVTLPAGETLPSETAQVFVARGGDRAQAKPAQYVSPAPGTDPVTQGETHYFRTAADGLRNEMRLDVWIARAATRETGVVVPPSSIVWATGQAWAYVQIDGEHFVRQPVATGEEAPGGWFVRDGLRPGDRLVSAGAQMLFAEEFRWQIRDEDNQ
ncbi:MAG: efflux RND transporter periplasmic adaptor subunit [Alphaproteobacteria bacterium]